MVKGEIRLKKCIIIVLMSIFLVGCSSEIGDKVDLEGKYVLDECIYVNFLSSSTKEYLTEQYSDIAYIEFSENIIIYQGTNEKTYIYNDIDLRKTSYKDSIDYVLNLEFENINIEIDEVYDIYDSDIFTGFSLIKGETYYYLVEARFLGNNNSYFIWQIFLLKHHE